jgi:hypothetical protein
LEFSPKYGRSPHEVDFVYLKGIRKFLHYVGHINSNALQRQQGVERNMITTGHAFKTQLSPTWGHEDVLVPRELGHWLQRSEHL